MIQVGTPSDSGGCRQVFCARHGANRDQMGTGRDPRGDGAVTCKIAGIAYTGSNPVPATLTFSWANAAAIGPVGLGWWLGFPPISLQPTRRRHPRISRALRARDGYALVISWKPLSSGRRRLVATALAIGGGTALAT
jgi:hypothetical protein